MASNRSAKGTAPDADEILSRDSITGHMSVRLLTTEPISLQQTSPAFPSSQDSCLFNEC